MNLDISRQLLNNFLLHYQSIALTTPEEWEKLTGLARTWFADLKDWENDDTFDVAYQARRMTVRAIAGGHQADDSGRSISVGQLDDTGKTRGTYPITIRSGRDGIEKRMDPNLHWKRGVNPQVTWSGKDHYGLHDMNASLLNPNRPWYQLTAGDRRIGQDGLKESKFGQMKPYIGGLYVFMPLPAVADLKVFFILQGLAKDPKGGSPESFQEFVRWMGKRLTRIKYAQERDMGIKYWDTGSLQKQGRPKIVMGGIGGFADYKNKPEDRLYAKAGPSDIKKRRELATDYERILKDDPNAEYNEVIITYRSHGSEAKGTQFPVYAQLASSGVGLVVDATAHKVITPNGTLEIVPQDMFNKYYNP